MTYCLDAWGPIIPDSARWLKEKNMELVVPDISSDFACPHGHGGKLGPIGFLPPPIPNPIPPPPIPYVQRWLTSQDLTAIQQLHAGVRYFDMKIARKPFPFPGPPKSDGPIPPPFDWTFYFVNGLYSTVTVEHTFREMAKWLAEHPREVVILACKSFDVMNDDDHQKFISQLMEIFSNRLCPHTEAPPTLQDCWDNNYQVILSYADRKQAANQKLLWPEIDCWWTKRVTAKGVVDDLTNRLQTKGRGEDEFFVAGLNVTPDEQYIASHPNSSLQKMTYAAYPQLMEWIPKQQPGAGKTCVNIIAADFVDFEFIQLVININAFKKN
ncbi:PI-PLC X domain-containing protein 1-like [Engraulis encrasicolus]|uniref:PI-PLC X domain-containing protein 1-like n=1 Tax=Engraulis encrasicolus TaxID=184585 RepID=UPI002FD02EA6